MKRDAIESIDNAAREDAERHLGRVALVTGATRGIGQEVAKALAEAGMTVLVGAREQAKGDDVVEPLRKAGFQAEALVIDLLRPETLHAAAYHIGRYYGRLDVLVNNAASGVLKGALELSTKHWDWMVNTNVRPLLLCAREAALLMGPGGRIISVSSLGAQRVVPNYAGVGVSKAALEALTRYLAVELADRGITVNAVSAGAVETEIWRAFPEGEALLAAVRGRTPGGWLVTPEELAEVVFFLASEAARPIRGQVIVVDAGYSLLA